MSKVSLTRIVAKTVFGLISAKLVDKWKLLLSRKYLSLTHSLESRSSSFSSFCCWLSPPPPPSSLRAFPASPPRRGWRWNQPNRGVGWLVRLSLLPSHPHFSAQPLFYFKSALSNKKVTRVWKGNEGKIWKFFDGGTSQSKFLQHLTFVCCDLKNKLSLSSVREVKIGSFPLSNEKLVFLRLPFYFYIFTWGEKSKIEIWFIFSLSQSNEEEMLWLLLVSQSCPLSFSGCTHQPWTPPACWAQYWSDKDAGSVGKMTNVNWQQTSCPQWN